MVTFQLLKLLGCNQIILVGQNLGFQNNKRYASGINYDFVTNELSEQVKEDLIIIKMCTEIRLGQMKVLTECDNNWNCILRYLPNYK